MGKPQESSDAIVNAQRALFDQGLTEAGVVGSFGEERVKCAAIDSIVSLLTQTRASRAAVVRAFFDDNTTPVQRHSAKGLLICCPDFAAVAVLARSQSPDETHRSVAAMCMSDLDSPAIRARLKSLSEIDRSEEVREEANSSLVSLSSVVGAKEKTLPSQNPNPNPTAASASSETITAEEYSSALLGTALYETTRQVATEAAKSLLSSAAGDIKPLIGAALTTAVSDDVRTMGWAAIENVVPQLTIPRKNTFTV